MTILCRLVGHERSRARASYNSSLRAWVSPCRRCASTMTKDPWPSDKWRLLASANLPAVQFPGRG
jgi:hypothetical protein